MFAKLLLVTLEFLRSEVRDRQSDITWSLALARGLDFVTWLGAFTVLANYLGLLELHEIKARGYDAIIPLLLALLWLPVKFLLVVLLPTLFACWLLSGYWRLLPRLVIYGVAWAVAAWVFHRAEVAARAEVARVAHERAMKSIAEEEARQRRQAEQEALRHEDERRPEYLKRLMTVAAQVQKRWRDDLEAAGTLGRDDVPPPVLQVSEPVPGVRRVRNAARESLCVKLVRTTRIPAADTYRHCDRDVRERCVDIAPGRSADFSLPRHDTSPGCRDAYLEYRVGNALEGDASWWSYSAVKSLERDPPDLRARYEKSSVPEIKAETARLEAMLALPDRAAHWREVLTVPAQ